MRSPRSLVAALLLGIALLLALPADAYADDHHLVFATDYHNSGDSLPTVLGQMPEDTEYVSIVGDLVGSMKDMWPAYQSSWILGLVQQALPTLTAKDVSIVWASHDRNVTDDAGIVKCLGGNTSGLIYTATDSDGSIACYVYAIGHYDMSEGEEQSKRAAAAFKAWVKGTDPCVPLIVVCHVPIHAARGDNYGASYWSEALNYAATGVEGLTATGTTAEIVRNVVFLHGHNHTNDETEYLYLPGSTMKVAVDVPSDKREKRGPKPGQGGEGDPPKLPPAPEDESRYHIQIRSSVPTL